MGWPSDNVIAAIFAALGVISAAGIAGRMQLAIKRGEAASVMASAQMSAWTNLVEQLRATIDDMVTRRAKDAADCEARIAALEAEILRRDAICSQRIATAEQRLAIAERRITSIERQ